MRVRIGNDQILKWYLYRYIDNNLYTGFQNPKGCVYEDLTYATDVVLTLQYPRKKGYALLDNFTVEGNCITVNITSAEHPYIGVYYLTLSFNQPDPNFADLKRKCVIDMEAYEVVSSTEEADAPSTVSKDSIIALGFQGKSLLQSLQQFGFTEDSEEELAKSLLLTLDAVNILKNYGFTGTEETLASSIKALTEHYN